MSNAITRESPLRIAIVGGGIAGLTLAVPLARLEEEGRPIRVHVYEAAAAFGEIGAGVAFGPNAQRMLGKLGLRDAVDFAKEWSHLSDEERNTYFELRRSDAGLSHHENLIIRCTGENTGIGWMHRADFLDRLIKMLPADHASFHKRLESYTDVAGSPVQLKFKDGTTAEADVVIGCDGIKSRTRLCLFAEDSAHPPEIESRATRAKYSGWVAYRGVVPVATLAGELGQDWGKATLWTGLNRHIIHFPVRKGGLVNIVGFVRDDKRAIGRDGPWQEEAKTEDLLEDFEDFNDTCKTILKGIHQTSIWGIFDLPELPWYAQGRVALSGDSAHGTTPHQGAGAGQCTENSYVLLKLLTHPDVLASRANIPLALQAYNHIRRPRASLNQRTSAEAGLLYEYRMPGVMGDIMKITEKIEQRFDWIWHWDEEKALAEANDYIQAAQSQQ